MARCLALLFLTFLCTSVRAQNAWSVFRFEHEGATLDLPGMMTATNTPDLMMAYDNGLADSTFAASVNETTLPANTLFPVGAPSAAPVCVAVLQLVERGEIDLDAPINGYLKTGKLAGGDRVTVRDLLLMKAKTGSGYKSDGYGEGAPRPSLVELAEGFRYRGVRKPQKSTEYGGWVFLQLLLEQHYGKSLNEVIRQEVFQPLCLEDMHYATGLSGSQLQQAAKGHNDDGSPFAGGYQRYVGQAAAGLWSSAIDYANFTRAILEIQAGKANSILRPETVQMALKRHYGHRSLIFHVGDKDRPYWGGNVQGFYFQMQVKPEENWVAVAVMNRNLNWRLGGPAVWQTGMLAKQSVSKDRLGIILQERDVDGSSSAMVRKLEHDAFVMGLRTQRLMATAGLPEEITATPAFVFQSPKGRAVYGGRHNDLEAVKRFVRLSQASPRKAVADERINVLTYQLGRRRFIVPVKFTPPSGVDAPKEWPEDLKQQFLTELSSSTQLQVHTSVSLQPQDRRFYLDVHAYRQEDGNYQLTYAWFSQFNCHTPVATNYGKPEVVGPTRKAAHLLTNRIHLDLLEMMKPEKGFLPTALPAYTPVKSWTELGWLLTEEVAAAQQVDQFAAPVAVDGSYRAVITKSDAPGLFFSFPSPLDRYSGEVAELNAEFNFSNAGKLVSGRVELPVASISTGSGSLDTYVLGDILKSEKYPTAGLVFGPTPVPGDWLTDRPLALMLEGELNIRGKTHPVVINATFVPSPDGSLATTASFTLDFKKVFGSDGPDGPEAIRRQLDFSANLIVQKT